MRKPDIFDEIIQCLKTGAQTGADASMDEMVLHDLYARPVRKAAPQPAVSVPVPGIQTRLRQGIRKGFRPPMRPTSPNGNPSARNAPPA